MPIRYHKSQISARARIGAKNDAKNHIIIHFLLKCISLIQSVVEVTAMTTESVAEQQDGISVVSEKGKLVFGEPPLSSFEQPLLPGMIAFGGDQLFLEM